jgi:hypothetical protein
MSVAPLPKDEPLYPALLDELRLGNAIPFLGAGASRVGCQEGGFKSLPSGSELANELADYANFPLSEKNDRDDLSKMSSYLVDGINRDALRRKLRSVFAGPDTHSTQLHRLLATVADNLMIVTTNYDMLLEQAFDEAHKRYDVVVYPADNEDFSNGVLWWTYGAKEPQKLKPNQIDPALLGKTNIIYKMHGTVRPNADRWDSFVITEEDYVTFLYRMKNAVPSAFRTYFSERAFLFLGYGLRDWNLRLLLKQVSNPKMKSWAILHAPSFFERTLWQGRNVKIFDMRLEDFVSAMEQRL